jgi:hypothetical protein
MRVTTWNICRAKEKSPVWELLDELHPDLVFLQEVGSIPERIKRVFDVLSKVAISKKGRPQRFSTAVLVKGKIVKEISARAPQIRELLERVADPNIVKSRVYFYSFQEALGW